MAIKSDLINIPLKGELNLSQNKLDVNNPAEGGYLKNNGVLYGNILSPVYKQNTNQQFDYMDASKNRWTISDGNLKKNGTTVMYFEQYGFTKETFELSNVDSLCDKYNYIELTSNGAEVHYTGGSASYSGYTVFATCMVDSYNYALVVYSNNVVKIVGHLGTSYMGSGSKSINITTDLSVSDLTAPVINIHKYTYSNKDYYCISLVTDSGSGVGSHQSVSWCWNSDNADILPLTLANSAGSSITAKTIEKYKVSLEYYMTRYLLNAYSGGTKYTANQLWLRPSALASGMTIRLYIQSLPNWTDASSAATTSFDSSSPYLTINSNGISKLNLKQSTTNINYHNVLTQDSLNNDTKVKTIFWLDVRGITENKDSYTQSEIDSAVNADQIFRWIPACQRNSFTGSPGSYSSANGAFSDTYYKNGEFAKSKDVTISSTSQDCDAFLADGTLIQTQLPSTDDSGKYSQGLYTFTGHLSSIGRYGSYGSYYYKLLYYSTSSESVLLGQSETEYNFKYPYKPKEGYGLVSLGWNYYRNNIVAEGVPYTEDNEEKKYITTLLYDSGFANSNGGVLMQTGYNESGGINVGSLSQNNKWRILYNNNLLAGISWSNDVDTIGTLVTDWLTVSKILNCTENDVYYLNNAGSVVHISKVSTSVNGNSYDVIRDRFIVINTTSYYNCYDLKTKQKTHWASDWNNRAFEGILVPGMLQITVSNNSILDNLSINEVVSMASAQNANYEMTLGRGVSSAVFPPEVLNNVAIPKTLIVRGQTSEPIDFYRADEGLAVIYTKSFKNNVFYKDTQLEGALYPVSDTASSSVMYNPNIFTQFVRTYNNNDMMISDGTAYPLMKYNGDVVMLALLTKGLENMQNIFVLQTLYYGIGDGKIWEIYYDNNTITNYQAIIDVKGMRYLGQLPTEALFWSPLNRSIYSFTGDAILKQLWHCNDISTIHSTFYNPATQELFISTNIGLLCVSNSYTYLLDDVLNVQSMFFYNDSFYIDGYDYSNDNPPQLIEKYWKVSYEHSENMDGKVHFATKYFGSIANQKIHINAVYVKLYNDWVSQNNKVFKIKETTVTDKSTTTTYKECNIDWDNDKWGYVRYQPQYQKGSSISFDVVSDAPIISMSVGYNVIDENAQFARNNI